MEKLINKNIFKDEDLEKLSPDYKPQNLMLRMQIRRTMVKDSHNHGVYKNTTWTRKSSKKVQDHFNIHKEMAKLRQEFSNMNLKNRLALKDTQKPPTNKSHMYEDGLFNECMQNLENDDLNEFTEDTLELQVYNNTEFKLNTKHKTTPQIKYYSHKKTYAKTEQCKTGTLALDKDINENHEDIFNVKCTFNPKKPQLNSNEHVEELTMTHVNQSLSPNDLDMPVSDLQKMFIMMALSDTTDDIAKNNNITTNNTKTPNIVAISDKNYDLPMAISTNPTNNPGIDDIINIIPLTVQITDKQKCIMKKVVNKWRAYVTKRTSRINEEREATLNTFFERVTKKKMVINRMVEQDNKSKHLLRDYNTYEHRYRIQKHIIALQKAKLEEQNRLIEELKYNKIVEASRQSVDDMREEVRKTYYGIDRQLRPKIKCLTNELKIPELEEPNLVLHCLKVPQFLQRMEKRAREREEKHAVIRERRRQMEEERIKLKQQEELAKAELDKEEKIQRIQELREKRKKERIENIRKKIWAERIRALVVMADLHYEKTLKTKYGIRPFQMLIDIKYDNIEKAKAHYVFQFKNNIFLHWMWYTEDMWYERNYKAEDFNRKKILKRAFQGFKMIHRNFTLKKQVAEDYYDLYVTLLAFRKLCAGIKLIKQENELKWQKAVLYHNINILFRTFTCWRTLPAINALQREQELRKARWRQKVLQVVPDYSPPDD